MFWMSALGPGCTKSCPLGGSGARNMRASGPAVKDACVWTCEKGARVAACGMQVHCVDCYSSLCAETSAVPCINKGAQLYHTPELKWGCIDPQMPPVHTDGVPLCHSSELPLGSFDNRKERQVCTRPAPQPLVRLGDRCTKGQVRRASAPCNCGASVVGNFGKFYCLRQVHLAENLPRATHTQNRVETT